MRMHFVIYEQFMRFFVYNNLKMTDKPSLKSFFSVSGINVSFIQHLSLNFQRVQYGNPVLHSITYLCIRH